MFTTVFRSNEADAIEDYQNIKNLFEMYFNDEMDDGDWQDMFSNFYL